MVKQIDAGKISIGDIYSTKWFRIPDFQRPYVWGDDEINDLLEDLSFAASNNPKDEYFLGSFVYQSEEKEVKQVKYTESILLDGQQRMTSLFLLFAAIRDRTSVEQVKESCQNFLYQKENIYDDIPERTRLNFDIRRNVQTFIAQITNGEEGSLSCALRYKNDPDISIKNMARAIVSIHNFFDENKIEEEAFYKYVRNNALMIYVSSENQDDAFRLFMVLNDRGVPLRNSDIIKTMNLGAFSTGLNAEKDKKQYAEFWEGAENELGEDFDLFLSHIRTLLVKEKARLNLLKEYESKIYAPTKQGKPTPALLSKGKDTFEFIKKHLDNYNFLLSGKNNHLDDEYKFDNLIKVMMLGLPSKDWVPPLLAYYDKFSEDNLFNFLTYLDNKFSADWILQQTPTQRIENMNDLIKVIEKAKSVDDVTNSQELTFDVESFMDAISGKVYGRRFARYILLKLDYHHARLEDLNIKNLSVEHILPQNPKDDSQWVQDFDEQAREELTHVIGNLVLISRRKNSSQGRKDYKKKKTDYFNANIGSHPLSLHVLNSHDEWKPSNLTANQKECVKVINYLYDL